MRHSIRLSVLLLFIAITVNSFGQGETRVTTWQNNAKAAQVFTLDDFVWTQWLTPYFYNETAPAFLYRHGLVATFGPIIDGVKTDEINRVRYMKHNIGLGHSIASHGYVHNNMQDV